MSIPQRRVRRDRPGDRRDYPALDGIADDRHDDGNGGRRPLRGECDRRPLGDDDVDLEAHQLRRKCGQPLVVAVGPPILSRDSGRPRSRSHGGRGGRPPRERRSLRPWRPRGTPADASASSVQPCRVDRREGRDRRCRGTRGARSRLGSPRSGTSCPGLARSRRRADGRGRAAPGRTASDYSPRGAPSATAVSPRAVAPRAHFLSGRVSRSSRSAAELMQ